MANSVKVGIIGCGNIFPQYIKGCRAFDILEVVACADIDIRARHRQAEEFKIAKACSVPRITG